MSKKITYDSAFKELTNILNLLQSDDVALDDLEKHIKRANELSEFCKERLRNIEEEVQKMVGQKEDI